MKREYRIFDTQGNILAPDKIVVADSPLKAVKTIYPNAKRDYSGRVGSIVVSCYQGKYASYVYEK